MSLISGTKLDRYQILSFLGAGGMGQVYRARDLVLGREVAIKVLPEHLVSDRAALKRLEREAKAIALLSHPNILDVHDFGNYQGIAYLVTELLEGRNLKSLIQKGPLPYKDALKIGISIAEGLYAAHSKGLIHRDLKPDNVFITSDYRVKILDFGLAVLKPVISNEQLSDVSTASGISNEGLVNGTVPYMSPEQLRGTPVDSRSDIFAFGSILYEMLVGKPPFLRETVADSLAAILREEPSYSEIDTRLPSAVGRLLRMCLEKEPQKRMPDAHHLVSILNETLTSPISSASGLVKSNRKEGNVWKWAIGFTFLLVITAFAVGYLKSRTSPVNGPEIHSLVVLPLKNMSGDPKDDYFVDGVTEEITSRLARIGKLRVISRTSAMQYKQTKKNLKEIGGELKVDAVLEGSIRRTEGRVRVVTNLIEANSDRTIWSHTYDQEMSDILSLQNAIAQSVSRELRAQLTPEEKLQLSRTRRILPQAYDSYLRGLTHEQREDYSKEGLLKEIEYFRQAVDLDPEFALAYTSLSKAHAVMQHFGYEPNVNHTQKAKEAVDNALELEPDMPEGELALGFYYYWCLKSYDNAFKHFGRASRKLPNNTKVLEGIAYVQRRLGNCEAALPSLQKALLLSPRELRILSELANTFSMMRRYSEADSYYDRAIALSPDQTYLYQHKAENYYLWDGTTERAKAVLQRLPYTNEESMQYDWFLFYLYSGEYQRARNTVESSGIEIFDDPRGFVPKEQLIGLIHRLSNQPDLAAQNYGKARRILEKNLREKPLDPRILSSLGLVYAALGLRSEAIAKGKQAVELFPLEKDAIEGMDRVVDLAKIYILTGNYDAALSQVELALSRPGFFSIGLMKLDPIFDPLRHDQRLMKLAAKYPPTS